MESPKGDNNQPFEGKGCMRIKKVIRQNIRIIIILNYIINKKLITINSK